MLYDWAAIHHGRRVNEHLQKTPEQREQARANFKKMLDDYRNGIGPQGLLYYDRLFELKAAMDEADKKIAEQSLKDNLGS